MEKISDSAGTVICINHSLSPEEDISLGRCIVGLPSNELFNVAGLWFTLKLIADKQNV